MGTKNGINDVKGSVRFVSNPVFFNSGTTTAVKAWSVISYRFA